MKGPVQSVEVTYLLHSTEDPKKVDEAVARLLSTEAKPEVEELEGHFGNTIVRVRLHLTGDEASRAFGSIAAKIPLPLMGELVGQLDSHLDEHSALFLRFDKQLLVSGSVGWGEADSVRVKVKPRGFLLREGPEKFYAKVLRSGP